MFKLSRLVSICIGGLVVLATVHNSYAGVDDEEYKQSASISINSEGAQGVLIDPYVLLTTAQDEIPAEITVGKKAYQSSYYEDLGVMKLVFLYTPVLDLPCIPRSYFPREDSPTSYLSIGAGLYREVGDFKYVLAGFEGVDKVASWLDNDLINSMIIQDALATEDFLAESNEPIEESDHGLAPRVVDKGKLIDNACKLFAKGIDAFGVSTWAEYLDRQGVSSDLRKKIKIIRLKDTISSPSDKDLEALKNFPDLEQVDLSWSDNITGKGFIHLKTLNGLKVLNLRSCSGIKRANFEHLSSLTSLTRLDLGYTGIKDENLKFLMPLDKLTTLSLAGCPVTGEGLKYLKDLPPITKLYLYSCKEVRDGDLEHLSEDLTTLSLGWTNIGDKGLTYLPKSLTELSLSGMSVTDEGLRVLSNLEKLVNLDLNSTKITGAGIKVLAKSCPNLTTLKLVRCKNIAGKDLRFLSQGITELDLSECEIAYTGLKHLPKNLKKLRLAKYRGITKLKRVEYKGITKAVLKALPENLKELDLTDCRITDICLKFLPEGLTKLNLSKCSSKGDMLQYLPKSLVEVNLSNCYIENNKIQSLKDRIKGINVIIEDTPLW